MGDLANMTDNDGRVHGPRLLRWLRSREATARKHEEEARQMGEPVMVAWSAGRRELLESMADDLEAELTPPDYPEDDGEDRAAFMAGPHDPHKRSPGADDDGVDLDDPALGGTRPPCPVCGGSVVRGPQDADDLCVRCSPNL